MAWKTWTAGDVLTAADINAQSPTLCTSSTRPTGGNLYEGVLITETDTNRILYYDGTGWIIVIEPRQTWASPFATGLTAGNGTWTGEYHRSDGWIDIRGRFTFGSTSAVTGSITFTMPIAPYDATITGLCQVNLYDDSAGQLNLGSTSNSGTPTILVARTDGTYGSVANTSSTVPWTWATTDRIDITGRYEMTTRYS
jgi:hypothetical protein